VVTREEEESFDLVLGCAGYNTKLYWVSCQSSALSRRVEIIGTRGSDVMVRTASILGCRQLKCILCPTSSARAKVTGFDPKVRRYYCWYSSIQSHGRMNGKSGSDRAGTR
jgi:hypothetical protein